MNNSENTTWTSRSWAKINLGLQVLNRLPDGYHEIATGFCFINWSDRFEMKKAEKFHLETSLPGLPVDQSNLIVKAVQTLGRYVDFDDRWSVLVDKLIPMGAGLGGGSSNAATMLRMLNRSMNNMLSPSDIHQLVSGLGADIPVFLHGKPGIGKGIGAEITFCDIQPDAWIVTVFPDVHVSTAEAYRNCTPDNQPDFPLERVLLQEPMEEWPYLLSNDLEPWAILHHPVIGDIKDQFYELGAVYASMSGSGSSVYGLFQQEFVAVDAFNLFVDWKLQANITPPSFIPDIGVYKKS